MADPWFKFYASDFLGGVAGLTPAERGVYVTLLCLIYDSDGAIDRKDDRLARVCGCTVSAFKKALSVLLDDGKITEENGRLTNDRAENELKNRSDRTQNARDAAAQRWSKKPEKSQQNQQNDDASAMHEQCIGNAIPEARSQSIEIDKSISCPSFSEFWVSWPFKVAKSAAEKAWKKLSPQDRREAFEKSAEWVDRWRSQHPSASPIHPATYLNQARWKDEDPTYRSAAVSKDEVDRFQADSIRSGHCYFAGTMSPARARELVSKGLVTEQECRKAGVL